MPIDISNAKSPEIMEIEKVSLNGPLRLRLQMKDGSQRTEDACVIITKLLKLVQELKQS